MCGIAVAISKENSPILKEIIQVSTDIISHRGPDGEGFYIDSNIALGHRRLSIIDLSNDGAQPMHRHNLVITYNGEIFNYIELREELKTYGYKFETETDTEIILNAYHHWGVDCQNHFNGMWAFALYDTNKNILFCSRDRFSVKPFVYTQCGQFFLIASEIKQFLHVDGFECILNRNTAFDFLERGLLNHNNETFFQNVFTLQGGHQLIYDLKGHNFKISRWYKPNFEERIIDFKEAKSDYEDLLRKSINLRLRSDVKVGFAVSGGIDSSGIACIAKELDKNGIYKGISSCYEDERYNESKYVEFVANKIDIDIKKCFPNLDDLLTEGILDKIIWHQEQPISSASHFSEFSVFQEARNQDINVMLCGQGPDEHSAGYGSYFSVYQLDLLKNLKLKKFSKMLYTENSSFFNQFKKFIGFLFLNALKHKQTNFLNYNYFGRRSQKPKMGLFSKTDKIRKLSIEEVFKTSIPYQAHSEDRNSMCFSIESRSPYLDHKLLEFAVSLPDDFKIKNNLNKYILREVLKSYLPKEVYERKDKMGFVAPDEIWFKCNSDLIKPQLMEAYYILNKLVNTNEIMDYFDAYVKGDVPFSTIFLKVLSMASLFKQYKIQY
jgi:asparagine synthase (glutamine-hydrolysing)